VTFNGEIYNYQEVRAALEKCGRRFATHSDTEVLISAIAEWGEAAFARLRGMYAFALWDCVQKELWLARDPYGIKPLYFANHDGAIWFASQARALARVVPGSDRRDPAGLTGFYLWGHVPEPFTWWAGIRSLPAGQLLRIKTGSYPGEARAFARIEDCYSEPLSHPKDPSFLQEAISESVRYHLVADVPVGLFLSSGVDSAVIAALAVEAGARLKTITLAFDEFLGTPEDEAPLAEEIARRLGTDHTTVRVSQRTFGALLNDFFASMDQPTIDGLNIYLVSWAAATQGLKVALSGLGGDELFGGYPSFRQISQLAYWGQYLPLRRSLANLLDLTQRLFPRRLPPKLRGLAEFSRDVASAYILRRSLHLESELGSLLDVDLLNEGLHSLSTYPSVRQSISRLVEHGGSVHSQIAALESGWYMRNQLLRDADWASMRFGLEVRVPLVDYALLQRLGPVIRSPRPLEKSDLFACARSALPSSVGDRKKTGFVTPVYQWAAEGQNRLGGARNWASEVHRRFRADRTKWISSLSTAA
jgi:asparagine synthase (glutamine-hydrolysing)